MTKKCNFHFSISEFGWKRTFLLLLFVCLFSSTIFSQSSKTSDSGEEIPSWIIASLPFSFSQNRELTASENGIATEIPSLILGQLSGGLMRKPDKDEIVYRELYTLRQERQSLFLQISSETQKRDSHVLGNYSTRELAANIKESEEKLVELRKKIDENILKTENLRNGVEEETKNKKKNKSEKKDTMERVQLYQNDAMSLLKNDDGTQPDISSFSFSEKVNNENINAVLTGLITVHGSYVSCSAELYLFPEAIVIGTASEIGRSDNLSVVAQSIAEQLQPSITSQLPVRLVFSVFPEEAREETSLVVDDVVYPTVPESVLVHSGIHSILFSSKTFMKAGTTYAFTENSSYSIDVTLTPVSFGTAFLNVVSKNKKLLETGTVYSNAEKIEPLSEEENRVGITINGRPVLGEFVTEDGSAALFYVDEKKLNSGQEISVNVKAYDRSDVIEKRRKYTYMAYSIFIVSLIPTFYTYGNFDMERSAFMSGRGNYNSAVGWQRATWVSAGISVGAAAFWVYHLVRYLIAANKVLPAEAKQIR